MNLTREHLAKIIRVDSPMEVAIPAGVFKQGDILVLFNNTPEFMTLRSDVKTTYRSAHVKSQTHFEWPPRSLINVLFVDDNIAVLTVGL